MGDPKKQRKKYARPFRPWQKERIEEEAKLLQEYGLKNKREIWKSLSLIRRFKTQAKSLIAKTGKQAEKEKTLFLQKLIKLNILKEGDKIEDTLGLNTSSILERRLQTQLLRQGIAKSAKQARQIIVHGHITIGDKNINIPSYIVLKEEETQIRFNSTSPFANEEHPERIQEKKEVKTQTKKPEQKEKKEEAKAK